MRYKILIVDDEELYCKTFKSNVEQIGLDHGHEIEIHACHNWEDACVQLGKPIYDAVVLDAKCLVDRDQEAEDFGFLAIALDGLRAFERDQDRRIPFAVNTGYIGEREAGTMNRLIAEMGGQRFSKAAQKEDLVDYLLDQVDNAPGAWVQTKYWDVFEVFDLAFLNPNLKPKLAKLLLDIEKPSENEANLRQIRVLQEELYNELQARGIFSNGFNPQNRTPSFKDKSFFLSGNVTRPNYLPTTTVYQTSTIEHLSTAIHRITSDFGNHVPQRPRTSPVEYWERPSNYAVKSLSFALLEQFLWFKTLCQNR